MASNFPYSRDEIKNLQPSILNDADQLNQVLEKVLGNISVEKNFYYNILSSFILNGNTRHFINKDIVKRLKLKLKTRHGNLTDFFYKSSTNFELKLFIFLVLSFLDLKTANLRQILCFLPESHILYFYLSEIFLPDVEKIKDVSQKERLLKQLYYSTKYRHDGSRRICEVMWDTGMQSFWQKNKGNYVYPFPMMDPFFISKSSNKNLLQNTELFFFLSTPNSGTQSILYFISHFSRYMIRQFSEPRIFQKEESLLKDVDECIDLKFHIQTHFPLPQKAVDRLLTSGYKLFAIRREEINRISSGERHLARRASLYPIVQNTNSNFYRNEFDDFIKKNTDVVNFVVDFEDLERSTNNFFYELGEKLFPGSAPKIELFLEKYNEKIAVGALNYRR